MAIATITSEQARPFYWPPNGTRRRHDHPPCLVCGTPAEAIAAWTVGPRTVLTYPCAHEVRVED